MNEGEFISAIVSAADCLPHLGVGNIHVNGRNFGCDRRAFIDALPLERTGCDHVSPAITASQMAC